MYYVYILQNSHSGQFYIGQTNNLEDRLKRHNEGRAGYTKNKGKWMLYYSEEYQTRSAAVKREREIKSKKSKRYIEQIRKQESVL